MQFENFQNHEYLLFTNCTRRLCDFLFIVHSTKLRPFHGNVIGTPTEYNLGLIVLLSTIVSRGDWLGNSANFKETCLCLRILTSRDIDPAHNISRWRSVWKFI